MNDSDQDGCVAHPIARSAVGHVAACPGCGNVQLTLEYLTVRFQPAAFRELVGLLALAQRRLDADQPTRCVEVAESVAKDTSIPADEKVH